ncbi:MAG: DUF4368 domain-containing protein [Coprobacillaceae bacterium]
MIKKNIELQNNKLLKINRIKNSIKDYENKISTIDKAIKNLYIDKVKEIISNEEYMQLSKDFHRDKLIYQKTIINYNNELTIYNERILNQKNKEEIVKQYTNITNLTREIIDVLIDKIYIGKRDTETKELPINIHWNF